MQLVFLFCLYLFVRQSLFELCVCPVYFCTVFTATTTVQFSLFAVYLYRKVGRSTTVTTTSDEWPQFPSSFKLTTDAKQIRQAGVAVRWRCRHLPPQKLQQRKVEVEEEEAPISMNVCQGK